MGLIMSSKKIGIIAGTRPEAIKLAPVYLALKKNGADVEYIKTGQHDELHDQVTSFFGINHDVSIQIPFENRSLSLLCSELYSKLDQVVVDKRYAALIVQGDTASAFCGSQVGFLNKLKTYHVEAGLRSNNLAEPFPEEAFRRLISVTADKHFCPTIGASENLIHEQTETSKIIVTGNTVVDAIRIAKEQKLSTDEVANEIGKKGFSELNGHSFALLTIHRRENHGDRLDEICDAIKSFLSISKTKILCPVHPNPAVKQKILEKLSSIKNVVLTDSLSYPSMIWALENCKFIASDSGGLQEEAPSFRKKILILREQTERPEVIESGWGELIGANYGKVNSALIKFDSEKIDENNGLDNPFGDGFASEMVANEITNDLGITH